VSERLTRLRFRRTGGFAGNMPPLALDSADLSSEEMAELERLLAPADLGAAERAGKSGSDPFQYELDVETTGQHRRLSLGEREVPPSLRPLLTHLTQLARRRQAT
jgi:hypothetical protein